MVLEDHMEHLMQINEGHLKFVMLFKESTAIINCFAVSTGGADLIVSYKFKLGHRQT